MGIGNCNYVYCVWGANRQRMFLRIHERAIQAVLLRQCAHWQSIADEFGNSG